MSKRKLSEIDGAVEVTVKRLENGHVMLYCWFGKQKVGYVNLTMERKHEKTIRGVRNLATIEIFEGERGKGYGTALMNKVIEFCTGQRGVKRIVGFFNNTYKNSEFLRTEFYPKFGFTIKPEGPGHGCYELELILR